MDSFLGHLQINIDKEQIGFYKDFFSFLNWNFVYEDENALGVLDKHGSSVWFIPAMNQSDNDYDGVGMNHLAISVSAQSDVDKAAAWLAEHEIPALFETPRHRPDFSESEEKTYYQVMFESPDRVLLEVVYTGPKQG